MLGRNWEIMVGVGTVCCELPVQYRLQDYWIDNTLFRGCRSCSPGFNDLVYVQENGIVGAWLNNRIGRSSRKARVFTNRMQSIKLVTNRSSMRTITASQGHSKLYTQLSMLPPISIGTLHCIDLVCTLIVVTSLDQMLVFGHR